MKSLRDIETEELDLLFREATREAAMTASIHRLCDHWTPEQKRKAEEALEQHRAHEENSIMNEALSGIPCAGYVEVPKDYDPRGRAG